MIIFNSMHRFELNEKVIVMNGYLRVKNPYFFSVERFDFFVFQLFGGCQRTASHFTKSDNH